MTTTGAVVGSLLVGLLTVLVLMAATALRARQLGKVAVVDVAWGAGFVLVALVAAVWGQATAGATGADAAPDVVRRWLVAVLVACWGLRLAWHVRGRALGEHQGAEDPRYQQMLGGSLPEVGLGVAVRRVFAVQGVALWLVSVPVMVGAALPADWWALLPLGVAVWALGLTFETVGDRQLAAYKRQPREERPPVMDRGLWAWTRHPNYFGDACVWWGLWLAAGLSSGPVAGIATVLAPVAMTFFLRNATGAKLLEQEMMKRPGYPEYAERTPMFVPRPPRRR